MKKSIYASFLMLGIMSVGPAIAADTIKAQKQSAASQSVQTQVDKNIADETAEKRKKILEEAVAAVLNTEKALVALENNKTDEALKLLETVTGKLDLIMARDPDLALAPVDIHETVIDVYTDVDSIKAMTKEAKKALDKGRLQDARNLIKGLASEIIISTTSIPLATYPDAIKAIAPLIDEGKVDEAKLALHSLLSTLVVTEHVIPLPLLRASLLMAEAEALTENSKRTEEENKALDGLLKAVKHQLELAEALGYGDKESFEPMYEQIEKIEDKVSGGKGGKGWFDKLKQQFSAVFKK
jgi:hypothetical protein